MIRVPEGPGLVWVKVCVSSNARAWEIGVGEESPLPVEGRTVTVKTRGEDDGDVHVTPASLEGAVRNGLKAQGSHTLPHVKRPPDGVVSFPGAHLWRDIFYASERDQKKKEAAWVQIHSLFWWMKMASKTLGRDKEGVHVASNPCASLSH